MILAIFADAEDTPSDCIVRKLSVVCSKLRVHLVRDDHNVWQDRSEIHGGQVTWIVSKMLTCRSRNSCTMRGAV